MSTLFGLTTEDGMPLIGIGLSRINVSRLLAGEPVLLDFEQWGEAAERHGLTGKLMIVYGDTEERIADEIQEVADARGSEVVKRYGSGKEPGWKP